MKTLLRPLIFSVFAVSANAAVLLEDDYRAMKLEMLSSDVVGAHTEYHYLGVAAPKGNWVVSNFRTNPSQRAWRLIEEEGERYIWQSYTESDRERPYTHPIIIAGDEFWTDYTFETRFAPETDQYQSGVIFRYRNDRIYYFAGVIGQKAVIKKVNDGVAFRKMDEKILAEKPFAWTPGSFISVSVSALGDKLTAVFDDDLRLEATDGSFRQGKIGLTSDVPTKFARVRVTASDQSKAAFEKARKARDEEEAALIAANPKMKVWKKIYTPGFGVGRNLRFGDLDGDGRIDILVAQVQAHGPNDGHCEVGCMTALTVDGKQLWRIGTADSWNDHLTSDVGVQIHDVDGDGRNEVVYCRDMQIVVADGATGNKKFSTPTPLARNGRTNDFPRILGDCLYFCDFRGLGADRDIIVKDRYRNIWAYAAHSNRLEFLWDVPVNTGHYPYAYDVDGDGKDELAVGYALVNHQGKKLFDLDGKITDHADGVAILPHKPGAAPMLQCAASDEGFYFADLKGNIIHHYQIGHCQNPSVADYRPDLPGLETVVINFWANQGIVNFFDSDGKRYHDFEPAQHGSMMLPLNWKGDGQEYWILSPNVDEGVYDGWGRRVLKFPADGHPDMCVATLDMTGDARDEIVVWDPWEIWIYTQADGPKTGKVYKPKRNPLYNYSNYQTTVSLPGWTE